MKYVVLLWMLSFFSPGSQEQGKLRVTINNIKKVEGSIQVAIFNSDESFMKDALETRTVKVLETGSAEVEFTGLPFGRYSLSIFHDLNENEELDTNFLGIPKEPFGFSNDAMGAFGPPSFHKASIEIQQAETETSIKLKSL